MDKNPSTEDVDRRTAVATDSGAARIVTARRRLMLGAAAVLPSVVTLPAGAQRAAGSFNCVTEPGRASGGRDRYIDATRIERFSDAPDQWLRKKVFSGRLGMGGRPVHCTTWDQSSILAIAKLESVASGRGYKALPGTAWSNGSYSFRISGPLCGLLRSDIGEAGGSYCTEETVDNISPEPDHWGLVYVDETGLSCALEPGPGLYPVRATCFASIIGDSGSSLG